MTEQERKTMMILADTIQGEINRMCVTKDLHELDTMAFHAYKNIEKLQNMRFNDFKENWKKGNEKALTIGELRGFQGRSISDGEFSGKGGWVD